MQPATSIPINNPLRQKSSRKWTVIFNIHIAICVLVLAGAFFYSGAAYIPSHTMVWTACVTLLFLYVWSVWSWYTLTGSLFNPYVLFLTSAYIFNGGQTFLEIFGLNEQGIQKGYFSDQILLETIFLIIIAFLGIHIGGLLSHLLVRGRSAGNTIVERQGRESLLQASRLIGWGMIAVAIIPAYLEVKDTLILSITVGYMAIFTQEISRGYAATGSILAEFIIPGFMFVLAGSRGRTLAVWAISLMVFGYSVALFMSGNRGTATMVLIAYAWVFHRCIRPVPRWILLSGGAFILFIVIPLISIIRNDVSDNRLSVDGFVETFTSIDNPLVAPLSEMGNSIMTVAYTVSMIPGAKEFEMGVGYLYGLLGIFPNLFWDVHPSFAHGTGSLWLLQAVAPQSSLQGGWGFGYSFIAEAYYNFGFAGTPIITILFGLFIGWFVLWAEKSGNPARIAAVGAFTSFVLIFARSEFFTSFGRPLVWYSLIPYCAVVIWLTFTQRSFREKAGTVAPEEAKLTEPHATHRPTRVP